MSNINVKLIDTHRPTEEINPEDLTQTELGSLMFQCELLLESLKDAEALIDD